MAELVALPLFTDAYLADTRHLNATQHGAYLLLLMMAWRTPDCALPDDDKILASWASMDLRSWKAVKPIVMAFWKKGEDGKWRQDRLSDESELARAKRKQRVRAGKASALKRHEQASTSVQREVNERSTNPEPEPEPTKNMSEARAPDVVAPPSEKAPVKKRPPRYPDEFEAFWKAYPTDPGMSKAEAFKGWVKLDDEAQSQAIGAIPAFKAWCKRQGHEYRTLHAVNYLKQRRFEGLVVQSAPSSKTREEWLDCLRFARASKTWPGKWGPCPNEPGCIVPADLVHPNDGLGWAEWKPAATEAA